MMRSTAVETFRRLSTLFDLHHLSSLFVTPTRERFPPFGRAGVAKKASFEFSAGLIPLEHARETREIKKRKKKKNCFQLLLLLPCSPFRGCTMRELAGALLSLRARKRGGGQKRGNDDGD